MKLKVHTQILIAIVLGVGAGLLFGEKCRYIKFIGDIFIQPQPVNSFNPFLLQAMSHGSAIATCKGGVDDLIIENQTAVVFDPNDELNIMHTLQNLLSKREFARKIAKNAQQYVKKNHSVSNMISAYLRLYKEQM